MKKPLSVLLAIICCFFFVFGACSPTDEDSNIEYVSNGTNDAISYYSSRFNKVRNMETNSKNYDIDMKKGDICKYGVIEEVNKTIMSEDNSFWKDVADSFGAIFGMNDGGYVFVTKTQEIDECMVWVDQWTNNPDGGNTVVSNISEFAITSTIKKSLSFNADYANINCETAVSNTQTYVNNTSREYKYNLSNYDTEKYKYAWAIIANTAIYRVDCFRLNFWEFSLDYVGTTYTLRVNEINPDWERVLLYRPVNS